MNRLFFLILFTVAFAFSGCSTNNGLGKEDKVSVNDSEPSTREENNDEEKKGDTDSSNLAANKDEPISTNADLRKDLQLTITYTNQTEDSWIYGAGHILQKKKDQKWIEVPSTSGWIDVGYVFEPETSFEEVINLKDLYGELTLGHYQVIKEMTINRIDDEEGALKSEDEIEIITQFEIK